MPSSDPSRSVVLTCYLNVMSFFQGCNLLTQNNTKKHIRYKDTQLGFWKLIMSNEYRQLSFLIKCCCHLNLLDLLEVDTGFSTPTAWNNQKSMAWTCQFSHLFIPSTHCPPPTDHMCIHSGGLMCPDRVLRWHTNMSILHDVSGLLLFVSWFFWWHSSLYNTSCPKPVSRGMGWGH